MIEYTKEIGSFGSLNGYVTFCDTEHPLAFSAGWVYYHRHVASLKVGYWISSNEHVHHIDGNRANNDPDNLHVLSHSEHAKLHNPVTKIKRKKCPNCKKYILRVGALACKLICCSPECAKEWKAKIDWPAPEEMKSWVWREPTTKIAKALGVSDKAVDKFCKRNQIEKPPRGYWAKVEAGKILLDSSLA